MTFYSNGQFHRLGIKILNQSIGFCKRDVTVEILNKFDATMKWFWLNINILIRYELSFFVIVKIFVHLRISLCVVIFLKAYFKYFFYVKFQMVSLLLLQIIYCSWSFLM